MFQSIHDIHRARPSWLRRAGRFLTALALMVAPLLALETPSSGQRSPSSTTDSPSVFGDETVGTLPIFAPPPAFDLLRFLMDREASLYLEGNRLDVLSSIVQLEGRTVATLELLDVDTDTVRVTFHGRPRLVLDRAMIEAGALRVGVNVPAAFGQGSVRTFQGHRFGVAQDTVHGALELPFAGLGVVGATAPRRGLVFDGQDGAHTVIAFQTTRRYLILDQAH